MLESLYRYVGRTLLRTPAFHYAKKLRLAGVRRDPYEWFGGMAVLALLYALVGLLAAWTVFRIGNVFVLLGVALALFALVVLAVNAFVNARLDDRKNKIERVLPDALQIMAANIRAGMTPVVALRASARPEFGPMEDEIKAATSRALGAESLVDVLNEMSERIPSPVFQRTVALVASSLKGGGRLAQLLEGVADDIRQNQQLKTEFLSNTNLYVMFILFTVALGTPLLLAVSYQFTVLVTKIGAKTLAATPTEFSALLSLPFSADFVFHSALFVLIVNSLLAAALVGAIREGRETSGLRYAPIILAGALGAYFFLRDYALAFLAGA